MSSASIKPLSIASEKKSVFNVMSVIEATDPAILTMENSRLRGDLLTVARRVIHDLRTPLGSITAAGEMLKEVFAESDPKSTSLVAPVFASAEELARILDRVGFVLKASAHPDPKLPVPMAEPVTVALQRLERRIVLSKASITQPSDWPIVSGVARWLETIWWNFLANSLQYGGPTPRINLHWRESDGQFRFWIVDSGSGVLPEARQHLFQPFHTLHEMNSTRVFGLSIVQRLVELQGGSCGYEGIADGGACFYFTLPAGSTEVTPS